MVSDHPFGKPIVALKFGEDENSVFINSAGIEEIFDKLEVQDRKIVVFSIIGAFRGGKSYFLDYCLRYLYAHYPSINNPNGGKCQENWMGKPNEPLQGFSWRSGIDRDTSGIVMWSDVFLHTMKDTRERIAILVIDTQGLFDHQTSTADNCKIFALGSLLSSIQVLNLSIRIQEDQLHYLHFATDFAQCIAKDQETHETREKPFQKLLFLIRDFPKMAKYTYGIDGGNLYIEKVLNDIKSNQRPELQSVRQHISSTFQKIECCLLPRPGDTVCDEGHDGRLSEMSDIFKENLKQIIDDLLLPENLITKKVNGLEITGKMMKKYVDTYFELIQSNNIQIRSFADATIENYMNDLVERCLNKYEVKNIKLDDMENLEEIPMIHEKCKNEVLEFFNKEKKLGTFEHLKKFRNKLKEKIKVIYKEWKENVIITAMNDHKNAKPDEAKEIMNKVLTFAAIAGIAIISIEAPIVGVFLAKHFMNSNMLSSEPKANSNHSAITIPDFQDEEDDSD